MTAIKEDDVIIRAETNLLGLCGLLGAFCVGIARDDLAVRNLHDDELAVPHEGNALAVWSKVHPVHVAADSVALRTCLQPCLAEPENYERAFIGIGNSATGFVAYLGELDRCLASLEFECLLLIEGLGRFRSEGRGWRLCVCDLGLLLRWTSAFGTPIFIFKAVKVLRICHAPISRVGNAIAVEVGDIWIAFLGNARDSKGCDEGKDDGSRQHCRHLRIERDRWRL